MGTHGIQNVPIFVPGNSWEWVPCYKTVQCGLSTHVDHSGTGGTAYDRQHWREK